MIDKDRDFSTHGIEKPSPYNRSYLRLHEFARGVVWILYSQLRFSF